MDEALAATRRWLLSLKPSGADLRRDSLAGLPGAIASVPDGMAASVLAGVNPIYGLYASFAGPIAGGIAASSRLMVVAPTSAAALAAGSTLFAMEPADRAPALFLMVLLAGTAMVLAGLLRLGRWVRFVSHSVMIGFLTGVAANIVLGQIPNLTGAPAEARTALSKALDVLRDPQSIDPASLVTGLIALLLLALLSRTRLRIVGALIALVLPTVFLALLNNDSVRVVADMGTIPAGLPVPDLPDFGALSPHVIAAALSIAVIVLVQGAGVAESAPNPDGTRANSNTNFIAQGVGNMASACFQGLAVGGSVANTAINVAVGARTRWASILSGVWMLLILALFSTAVAKVAMPTLAAILMFAAIGSVRVREIDTIMRTGFGSRAAAVVTFGATLFLPIQYAVGIGVALSLLLQLNADAMDLKVVELVPQPDGTMVEKKAPTSLPSNQVTALDVYGSLLYAGSRTMQARLPAIGGASKPVVVLRLRGRTSLGTTFFVTIADYAHRLAEVDGRLYLSGVDPRLMAQFMRTGRVDLTGPVQLFSATEVVGGSTQAAYRAAQAWLVEETSERPDGE
jgi:SulP family sulfate permease